MAWQTPKTDWQAADVVSKDDFNRIEGNAQYLKDAKADKTEFNLHVNNKNNPHNVTASQVGAATPAQLAAKVDKPSSAVSGNIAVFDGGAGKIKDGGKTIQQVSAPYYATGIATLSFTALTEEWSAPQYVSTGCSCVDVFIAGDQAGFTFQLTPGKKAMSIIKEYMRPDFYYEYISSPKYTNDILLASSTYNAVAGQLLSDGRLRIVARKTTSGYGSVNITVLWRGWN